MVERVTFPFIAAVAQLKHVLHHENHGLGGGDGSLERWSVMNVADFDGSIGGIDSKVAGHTGRLIGTACKQREKEGIATGTCGPKPVEIVGERFEGTIRQIGPSETRGVGCERIEEASCVFVDVERFEADVASVECVACRVGRGLPER